MQHCDSPLNGSNYIYQSGIQTQGLLDSCTSIGLLGCLTGQTNSVIAVHHHHFSYQNNYHENIYHNKYHDWKSMPYGMGIFVQ